MMASFPSTMTMSDAEVNRVDAMSKQGRWRRTLPLLMAGSAISIAAVVPAVHAQAPAPASAARPAPAPALAGSTIRSIDVAGTQRIEAGTVLSYTKLRVGDAFTQESLDAALKDLYATELFSDVQIRNDNGALTVQITENPVINRIVLEGNKRLKDDKILPEIKMAPRQIYTRSKVRADVARIIELYRRQGRFAASVEPKLVTLDQNRVDIVYEISEGPKSKVRRINIIGNEEFSDGKLRGEMATKQTGLLKLFSSGTTYDPDRLAYDQQKLRQFYLTQGYADFRVVSAVAELTPDKQDFIITYVVEEGERYKFGDVAVKSEIRELNADLLQRTLTMEKGDWYNAKLVENTVEQLSETAGQFGYAFAEVQPDFNRDQESRTMGIAFNIGTAPRVYVERIDINGNTLTKDKVIRREFRLQEGDAFNTFLVKRSQDRINSLGYFQERLQVEQKPGSQPDRIILETNVEEKATGELQLSAGFSSLERFILAASVRQRNFRGMGQELGLSVNYSNYSKSAEISFTEPYFLDRNIALGGSIFRRDLNSFNYINDNDRNTTYEQTTTGFQLRMGVPLTEYISLALRYGLSFDDVTLARSVYFTDKPISPAAVGDGILGNAPNDSCDPLRAGRYLCDAIGKRTTSSLGYSLIYDRRDNRIRPTRGFYATLNQDVAGLGGDVRYIRSRLEAGQYFPIGGGFVFSIRGEGGHIASLEGERRIDGNIVEKVRLTDRFFLGEPQLRGFDIRGVGPRVTRTFLDASGNPAAGNNRQTDDALGGKVYYLGHLELEIPLGSGARELGLRPSIFMDVGAVGKIRAPSLINFAGQCQITQAGTDTSGNPTSTIVANVNAPSIGNCSAVGAGQTATYISGSAFREQFLGDTLAPRLSVGFGVNWNSPFGPFRIDIAKALLKEPGDDTKLITFNIGTQF